MLPPLLAAAGSDDDAVGVAAFDVHGRPPSTADPVRSGAQQGHEGQDEQGRRHSQAAEEGGVGEQVLIDQPIAPPRDIIY